MHNLERDVCYQKEDKGLHYNGEVSVTVEGHTCQKWSSQYPHNHGFHYEESNYCRNPDGTIWPWCYTTNKTRRWDLCEIPPCSGK